MRKNYSPNNRKKDRKNGGNIMSKSIDLEKIANIFVELLTFVAIFCGVAVVTTVVTALANVVGSKVVCLTILTIVYLFMDCI